MSDCTKSECETDPAPFLNVPTVGKINDVLADGEMKLSGKQYLPVAFRVAAFRQLNPNLTIVTQPEVNNERSFIVCAVKHGQLVLATARKEIKWGSTKGASKDFPLETAETGAIGRALALCGFGTLMGDLDEDDQISDAPVQRNAPKGR